MAAVVERVDLEAARRQVAREGGVSPCVLTQPVAQEEDRAAIGRWPAQRMQPRPVRRAKGRRLGEGREQALAQGAAFRSRSSVRKELRYTPSDQRVSTTAMIRVPMAKTRWKGTQMSFQKRVSHPCSRDAE